MAAPHPDWLTPVADEVAALEEVVEDWAAARLATARTRALVYCMLVDGFVRVVAGVLIVGCYLIRETGR